MSSTDYTPAQREAIKEAIRKTRAVLEKYGEGRIEPRDFAQFFARYNGIHIPGRESDSSSSTEVARGLILGLRKSPKFDHHLDDVLRAAIRREVNRAHQEIYWLSGAKHSDAVGFRMLLEDNVEHRECCERFVQSIDYGLGLGVFPKDEVAVLPPCCDRAYFEVVFSDEVATHKRERAS